MVEFGKVLKKGPKFEIDFNGDVSKIAEEKGMVREVFEGQFVYFSSMVKLFNQLEALFRKDVVEPLGFDEWTFPRLLPIKALEEFGCTKYTPELLYRVEIGGVEYALDPVQCAALYYVHRGKVIEEDSLPMKIFEAEGGFSYRDEKSEDLDSFLRAREFLRLESVYIGSPEQVVQIRKELEDKVLELLNNLELNWRITVGEPCCNFPSILENVEKAETYDQVPIHDIELWIPYKQKWQEMAGCGVEYDRLINDFDIKTNAGKPLWSGCVGVGLNRLAFCLLAQYGFDKEKWPEYLRAA